MTRSKGSAPAGRPLTAARPTTGADVSPERGGGTSSPLTPPETAPATSPEIDVRWDMANYGRPVRYTNSDIGLTTTKRHDRIQGALEELAAQLLEDGIWEEESDSVEQLTGEAWDTIETLLKAWAARADERRAAIRVQWAAEEAAKAGAAS